MSANAVLIQRNSKIYSKALLVVITIIAIFASMNIVRLVYSGVQPSSNFSVKENMDDFDESYFHLTINESEFFSDDFTEIQTSRETGLPNYKVTYMLFRGILLINQIILIVILVIVCAMLKEITKKESAFTLSNAKRLKIVSLLILAMAFLAFMLDMGVNFVTFFYFARAISLNDILLIPISLAVWSISFVIDYGCELQKEVDETL